LIERLKQNPIERFQLRELDERHVSRARGFTLNVMETRFLKLLKPNLKFDQRMHDRKVRAILLRFSETVSERPSGSLHPQTSIFTPPHGRLRFFLALEAELSPNDQAKLARYNQGFYEEPVAATRSPRKRKTES